MHQQPAPRLQRWGSVKAGNRIARSETFRCAQHKTSTNLFNVLEQQQHAQKTVERQTWNDHSVLDFIQELASSPAWSHRSLMLFTLESSTRRLAISITHAREFTALITLLIVTNCFFMLLFDPLQEADSQWNQMLESVELGFTIAFTIELL
eukprot:6158113-Prymnesium_polylepis.1